MHTTTLAWLVGVLFLGLSSTTGAFAPSRKLLERSTLGFQVTLKHVDAGGNYTKLELVRRSMRRSKTRIERLYAMASDPATESHVHAGNGEFLMELSIGTPPSSYQAILDTGSDLIWTQCKPCKQCFDQPTPIFDPDKSSSFSKLPCSSKLCSALSMSSCTHATCQYMYTYGDYSSTQGIMGTETFTFGSVGVPKIGFGCGADNEGGGFSQGSGLVGMGRGPLSLISQLDVPKFSYCLTSIDSTKTSTLVMGSLAANDTFAAKDMVTTPLITSPSSPSFYYLSLHGITVGDKQLPIKKSSFALNEDGTGGVIIDSGTTITYLEEDVFNLLKKEFVTQMQLPVDDSADTGLDLCFKIPSGATNIDVPKLIFHFEGNGADLDLPGENYIVADSSGVACLAMESSSGMSIFGNFQQQNMLVVHDLVKETISFVPKQCDQL
ncbi:aspartic proteinase nepenthesin-1 [Andrographis paniculata]|uniref:aspartic proteinase nepenthesin-1 n=1 Tax=Andrographis paniculata TaxID=175694 RepID=UPI0021E94F97|nr:aspartic proteinase nepenthesin-1 [Andrographis paniculata]